MNPSEYDIGMSAGAYLKATATKTDDELRELSASLPVEGLKRALEALEAPNPPGAKQAHIDVWAHHAELLRRIIAERTSS